MMNSLKSRKYIRGQIHFSLSQIPYNCDADEVTGRTLFHSLDLYV